MNLELDANKEKNSLGIGDSCSVNADQEAIQNEFCEGGLEDTSSSDLKKKGSSLSSTIKNLVRGRSRTRNKNEEKKEEATQLPGDSEFCTLEEKGENIGDSKNSFYKLLQNVSSSMHRGRSSSLSSSNVRESARDQSETVRSGLQLFRRSGSRTELESSESMSLDLGKTSTLGRLFGKRTPSKMELECDGSGQELVGKSGTLGRLFRRRSSSKTEVFADSSIPSDLKSASLSRRIGSSLMGAFGKKEVVKSQEAPQ